MEEQVVFVEEAQSALPAWEAPELVKVDVSSSTLNGVNVNFDGVGSS